MPRAAVLLAHGFEEIEAITIIDVLRRAGVEVITLGVEGPVAHGAHAVDVSVDLLIEHASGDWDAIVLPGGMPGASTLRDHEVVQAFLKKHSGTLRAAICAAPIALGAAGALEGHRATCYPGFEEGLLGATHSQDRVVDDGAVVTSRGPGTAMEFALHLVERLVGAPEAAQLRRQMIVA